MKHFLILFFSLFVDYQLFAQVDNNIFSVSTNLEKIGNEQYKAYVGDYFELTFTSKNGVYKNFIAPSLKDFQVISGPNSFASEQIDNGKRSSKYGVGYTLQPKRIGKFVINAAKATINNQNCSSVPMTIEVVKEEKTSSKLNAEPLLIQLQTPKKSYFIGEIIPLSYQLLSSVPLQDVVLKAEPDFNNFIVEDLSNLDNPPFLQRINGKNYNVSTLKKKLLFSQKTGEITLNSIAANVIVSTSEQISANRKIPSSQSIHVESLPISLVIKELPSTSPSDFSGGVGVWELAMAVSKNELSTDETLILTLTLEGNGDPKRIIPSKLQLGDSLEVYEPKVTNETIEMNEDGTILSKKTIEYLIVPKQVGIFPIQAFFTYFDTEENDYLTIKTAASQLTVTKGSEKEKSIENPTNHYFSDSYKKYFLFFIGFITIVSLFFGIFFYKKKRKNKAQETLKTNDDASKENQMEVQNTFDTTLANSFLEHQNWELFYKEINRLIATKIHLTFGIPLHEVTETSVLHLLKTNKINQPLAEKIISTLHVSNKMRFGKSDVSINPTNILATTKDIVAQL